MESRIKPLQAKDVGIYSTRRILERGSGEEEDVTRVDS